MLYNADFQIQQMERKVARAQGQRSQEEQQRLEKEIEKAQSNLNSKKEELRLLNTSNKQLQDERRNIERVIMKAKVKEQNLMT